MPGANPYQEQHRGDNGAYERYLRSMDASMRQKVALTAAYLPARGRVADMGMGSGSGSHALASLYPDMDVVGVDINPDAVDRARERFRLPNLDFRAGDIAAEVFKAGSLSGILDSSVLHHVTSFNGYDAEKAREALRVQAAALAENGVLVVRDFLSPGEEEVLFDLPCSDGDDSADPASCSSAALFRLFARQHRILSESPGFSYTEEETPEGEAPDPALKWRRFRVSRRLAAEFLLRKDYRLDWDSEIKEEYTYFTQSEFEGLFAELGLRVLLSVPLRNPWIVRKRFRGKAGIRDLRGGLLEYPSTNYIIVGERVPPEQGVALREGEAAAPMGFLSLVRYRHRQNGSIRDLVQRPHRTIDILPWFTVSGDVFVLARGSYPRPVLLSGAEQSPSLDGSRFAGYVTEPLALIQTDKPLGLTVEEMLEKGAGISPDRIREFRRGADYYPSPGGLQEEVRSALVEVSPAFVQRPMENRSGFSSGGRIQTMEARQLLRAAQVGGLPDARLEQNTYELLLSLKRSPGPWIGEEIKFEQEFRPGRVQGMEDLLNRPSRRMFERVYEDSGPGFLDLRCSTFLELDARGRAINQADFEFVVPKSLSRNTVCAALLCRHGEEVFLGLDDHDLPAVQAFEGRSNILVAPAWRIPRSQACLDSAKQWVAGRLREEFGVETGETRALGGPYHPSLGATPEAVHPLVFEVRGEEPREPGLIWVRLSEALAKRSQLLDGHLRIAVLRAAHALGMMEAG